MLPHRIIQQELTVEAALAGDRQIALQASSLDPMIPTISVARSLLNDYIEVNKPFYHGSRYRSARLSLAESIYVLWNLHPL